jgi:hypothetical protein
VNFTVLLSPPVLLGRATKTRNACNKKFYFKHQRFAINLAHLEKLYASRFKKREVALICQLQGSEKGVYHVCVQNRLRSVEADDQFENMDVIMMFDTRNQQDLQYFKTEWYKGAKRDIARNRKFFNQKTKGELQIAVMKAIEKNGIGDEIKKELLSDYLKWNKKELSTWISHEKRFPLVHLPVEFADPYRYHLMLEPVRLQGNETVDRTSLKAGNSHSLRKNRVLQSRIQEHMLLHEYQMLKKSAELEIGSGDDSEDSDNEPIGNVLYDSDDEPLGQKYMSR